MTQTDFGSADRKFSNFTGSSERPLRLCPLAARRARARGTARVEMHFLINFGTVNSIGRVQRQSIMIIQFGNSLFTRSTFHYSSRFGARRPLQSHGIELNFISINKSAVFGLLRVAFSFSLVLLSGSRSGPQTLNAFLYGVANKLADDEAVMR